MDPAQLSIALLAVVIAAISLWWISTTLKEGRKAIDESKNNEKEKNAQARSKLSRKLLAEDNLSVIYWSFYLLDNHLS